MNFDFVLLLPLLAIALAVVFPLFRVGRYTRRSVKSRRYRRILLGRLAVFVLPIATLIVMYLPFPEIPRFAEFDVPAKALLITKALLICAAVLIPAFLAIMLMTLRNRKHPKSDSELVLTESENVADAVVDANNKPDTAKAPVLINQEQSLLHEQANSETSLAEELSAIDLTSASHSTDTSSEAKSVAPSLLVRERQPAENIESATNGADSPAEVQEQLDRVSDLVDSHDLGNSDYSLTDEDLAQKRFSLNSDVPLSIESALTTIDMSSTELSKMSSNEISELVTTLRADKTRLSKLVIAQQASIDSERKAHDQSRVVARDAIKIMRDARNGQKFAEKIARRERSERKRLEQQYNKVAHALDNAMSIIDSRKVEDVEA